MIREIREISRHVDTIDSTKPLEVEKNGTGSDTAYAGTMSWRESGGHGRGQSAVVTLRRPHCEGR